jgi:hypothetical protein
MNETEMQLRTFNDVVKPGMTVNWDEKNKVFTIVFPSDFWDPEQQNLLLTEFEGVPVTCHEAGIRRLVRQLQAVAATGKFPENKE